MPKSDAESWEPYIIPASVSKLLVLSDAQISTLIRDGLSTHQMKTIHKEILIQEACHSILNQLWDHPGESTWVWWILRLWDYCPSVGMIWQILRSLCKLLEQRARLHACRTWCQIYRSDTSHQSCHRWSYRIMRSISWRDVSRGRTSRYRNLFSNIRIKPCTKISGVISYGPQVKPSLRDTRSHHSETKNLAYQTYRSKVSGWKNSKFTL